MNRTPARNRAISTPSQQPLIAEPSYPPIADYAAIGDGRTVALISRAGAIEWLCLPHFSAPSVFAAILDRDRGGVFAISPERRHTSTRRYIDDSNVLETTYSTTTGVVRVTDFMPVPGDFGVHGRFAARAKSGSAQWALSKHRWAAAALATVLLASCWFAGRRLKRSRFG